MPHIFTEFNWTMSLYRPSLELPEVRKFRPAFIDTGKLNGHSPFRGQNSLNKDFLFSGDGTKKMDPMLSCRVVVIKWVAQYTHLTRSSGSGNTSGNSGSGNTLNASSTLYDPNDPANSEKEQALNQSMSFTPYEESTRNTIEGDFVRGILYGSRENVNFVHEVYRQSFLLSFSHSPAIKKVISVYKDWIQLNVPELPPFLLEPLSVDKGREDFMNAMHGKPLISSDSADGFMHPNVQVNKEKKPELSISRRSLNNLHSFMG